MERFYRQGDNNAGSFRRPAMASNNQEIFAPTPVRLPLMIDNRVHLQQDVNVPGQIYYQQNSNLSSYIHDCPTPDISLYGAGHSMAQHSNAYLEYQEPNLGYNPNEQGQYFYNAPSCSKRPKVNTVDEDRVQYKQMYEEQDNKDGGGQQSLHNTLALSDQQGVARVGDVGNVRIHPEVGGSISGQGGSTPECGQTAAGFTSGAGAFQASVGKQSKLSQNNTTSERNAGNVSFKDGSTSKDISKQKGLQASGMRIFTGSVEKVMKWYKALQGFDVNTTYDVVARCVSIRPGKGCEKLLLLRDASGPVLQATYYEIDFLLPEVKPGSTIRVVGKMVGSNRMVAYKVREVFPGEVSSLPRLCAISQHMVTKLLNVK